MTKTDDDGASSAHLDSLLDQALADSFPASDPIALTTTPQRRVLPTPDTSTSRLDYFAASPEGLTAFRRLQTFLDNCGLEHSLLELVKLRASQLNGCAYCLDMHTKDALAAGENVQRLMALPAWHETPFFSERERTALAWTEALTQIAGGVSDALYAQARQVFDAKEITDLTLAVVTINGWNRLAISFRSLPGSYQPRPSTGKGVAPS